MTCVTAIASPSARPSPRIVAAAIPQEPEVAVKRRLDVTREERPEHEDPPEPEHHAGNRREHLHERADQRA
jgi:hypothetical protein